MFKSLRSRVIFSYVFVLFLSLGIASLLFYQFLVSYTVRTQGKELTNQAVTLGREVEAILEGQNPWLGIHRVRIHKFLSAYAKLTKIRIFFIDSKGEVIVDSEGPPLIQKQQLPKWVTGLAGESPQVLRRYLPELRKEVLLVSVPLRESKNLLVIVKPFAEVKEAQRPFLNLLLGAAAISFLISVFVGLYLSRSISEPILKLTRAAGEIGKGRFDQYIDVQWEDEIGRLARVFNFMAERVKMAYQAQRDFVANVSHEIRTPLTSIEGFSQALLDGVVKDEDSFKNSLRIINQESKRLVRLVRDLLALSSIDAGQLDLSFKSLDLRKFLRQIGEKFQPRADEDGIQFKVQVSGNIKITTDSDRLDQVLTNLLDNAFKYTLSGGTIALRATLLDSKKVQLEVEDSGVGIPFEDLPRIFDRFYRVEKSRSKEYGGAGLGLSICKEIIEILGGSIDVESKLGEGTKFTIELPISPQRNQ
ncbi:MAG: ATP-binding protein [Actinomycetota bacterium]|nr:ATP-binding protein [Actinomycetota bacterium]